MRLKYEKRDMRGVKRSSSREWLRVGEEGRFKKSREGKNEMGRERERRGGWVGVEWGRMQAITRSFPSAHP